MPKYNFPVPRPRGIQPSSCEVVQPGGCTRDMVLHTLLGRFAEENGETWELETIFNPSVNAIDIDIPDAVMESVETVGIGPNLQRYLQWLHPIHMEDLTGSVLKAIWMPAASLRDPPSQPATFVDHGISGAWQFTDNTDDTVVSNIRIPEDFDKTVAPFITICWSTTATAGDCEWQIEYLWLAPNQSSLDPVDDTLLGSTDANNVTASTTAEGLVMSDFILEIPDVDDCCLQLRVKRRGDLPADTIGDPALVDVELQGIRLVYTADKLGG